MKLSASLFFTDILPHKRRLFNKIVKNKIFNNVDPDTVYSSLKKAGVDGIELLLPQFTKATDEDLLQVKKIMDKHNLPILSVHQQVRFFTKTRVSEVTEIFRIAEMLGTKVIVLHMNSAGMQVFDQQYINAVHELQKKYKIKVGFENMEKFLGSLHRGHGWHGEKFAELMKKNDFCITLDTTHLAHSGGDITEFFNKNKDRIINIHLSDYRFHFLNSNFRPLRFKHLPVGEGELDLGKFIRTLKKENYQGVITMEIHTDLEGICESARKVHDFLK